MKKKLTRKVAFWAPKDLFESFQVCCDNNYKSVSEVFRDFMLYYVENEINEKKEKSKIDNGRVYRES